MFHPNLFFLFEILGFVSFGAILVRELYQRNAHRVYEILACAVFGMILEIGNTYLAHTYAYSENFLVNIAHVPVAIGLGWAVIVYCAMLLSDQYNIPWTLRPFMDALTALVLDLSMDAIAIRLGFWHWSIPLNQEWYGVPFENLVGWILVVLSFSFLARFIRTLNPKRILTKALMIVSPLLAYAGLVVGMTVFSLIAILPYQINNWTALLKFEYQPDFGILYNPQVQLWKLILLVIILVELVNVVVTAMIGHRKKYLHQFDLLSFAVLSAMHLFFFIAMFATGIYRDMPVLVAIGAVSFLVHCLLHAFPYLIHPVRVFWFRRIERTLQKSGERIGRRIQKSLR